MTPDETSNFVSQLTKLLEGLGWSVGRLSGDAEVAESSLRALLKGKVEACTVDFAARLSTAMGVTLESVLAGAEPVEEVRTVITRSEVDMLYAAGVYERSSLPEMVRRAIREFVSSSRQDPDVAGIAHAIRQGRARRESNGTPA